jgi:phenylacetate-CoA ligase
MNRTPYIYKPSHGDHMKKHDTPEFLYWDREIETLPRPDLEKLQLDRLRKTLERVSSVPFYQEKFKTSSITPDRIRSVDAVRLLPFTTKEDLRDQFPYGLLTVPLDACVRLHASSGTTGRSVAVLHTEKDIQTWSNMVAGCLYAVGVGKSDIFQNMAGYGLFTGGLGFHYGAQKLGVLTIPAGAGNSRRQINLMMDFGTTVIHLMPSFALYLIKVFEEMGVDPKTDTKLKKIFLGAEPHSEETRNRVETFYGADAYNSYGLSEMNGPGVSFECHLKNGLHIWEDNYILEVIDPSGDEPMSDGEVGEVVFTTLTRDAMPLIRYRTRDLASLISEPCPCGRTHRRISRISGRLDDMIIWKGVNIFPMQIEQVIMDFPEAGGTYLVLLETVDDRDTMTVKIEVKETSPQGDVADTLRKRITDALQSELLVRPEVELVPTGGIPVSEVGKAQRVIDKRKL